MKLNKIEKEYLIDLLEEESKPTMWENITIVNMSHQLVLQENPGRQMWEIENFLIKARKKEPELRSYFLSRRKLAKQILLGMK